MLALIESGGGYAHPANWSPFVVVGEGARLCAATVRFWHKTETSAAMLANVCFRG